MSIDRFNYLVGKLSTSMAAVLPRASVASELVKKIESDIKEKNSSQGSITINKRKSYSIDEKAFIDGLWEGSKNSGYNESVKDVEKSQFETFDNDNYDWYNKNDIIIDGSHLVDGKLKLNVKYKSGEYDYIYATDGYGRISGFATKKLQFTKRIKRLKHNSNTYDKQKGDHAGHLIADRFGGSKEVDNLVSQSALVNLSEYKKMENIWAKALKNNQNVELDIQVRYEGNSKRPSGFVINYAIDGISFNRTINN